MLTCLPIACFLKLSNFLSSNIEFHLLKGSVTDWVFRGGMAFERCSYWGLIGHQSHTSCSAGKNRLRSSRNSYFVLVFDQFASAFGPHCSSHPLLPGNLRCGRQSLKTSHWKSATFSIFFFKKSSAFAALSPNDPNVFIRRCLYFFILERFLSHWHNLSMCQMILVIYCTGTYFLKHLSL